MPQALSIGVTYETFWALNPRTLQPFVDAFNIRLQREVEMTQREMDVLAWRIGLYVNHSIVTAFNSNAKYPKQPLSIEAEQERTMTPADHAARFKAWAERHTADLKRKRGETNG